jgi:hypothetical protein
MVFSFFFSLGLATIVSKSRALAARQGMTNENAGLRQEVSHWERCG